MGQFLKHSIHTIAVQFLGLMISTAAAIVTARILGPEGKGQLTLILLIPTLSVTFGRLGVGHAVNFYSSRTDRDGLIQNAALLSFVLGLSMMAVALPAVYFMKDLFFNGIDPRLMVLVSFAIPLSMLFNHLMAMHQALYQIGLRNGLFLIQAISNFVLLLLLMLLFQWGLWGALFAYIASLLLVVIFSCGFFADRIFDRKSSLAPALIKDLLRYGIKSHIGNMLKDLSYRADILILAYFVPAASVGFYAVAITLSEIVWKIPDAIGSVLLPKVAHIDASTARTFTPAVSRAVVWSVGALAVGLFTLGGRMIELVFGRDFIPALEPLLIMLPGTMSLTLWKIIANDMIAQGYALEYSFTTAIALVAMVVFDLLLIPRFGISGAALAATIAYVLATAAIIALYLRRTRLPFKSLVLPTRNDWSLYRGAMTMIAAIFLGSMRRKRRHRGMVFDDVRPKSE
jgi:O-antigen/teichoic acid export membrane protein